ncbi:class II glutamine amidotransferase [Desulforamulus ruminis]|uniref:Glutamine amidotransferase, class-II n=1 Tax=Desulforamulus ruminis (strain ATCC 23193 / DSM 2154 / NCIMB 8452 / DL) TaxID=696281 RepID=F6DTW9_DESRL|nr:glutamine amidotransferase [Desulforamulus ruminis]AEG58987.1 glutamine amidotransferase, class-II [Desulforamulus ruminis DSM 2154]
MGPKGTEQVFEFLEASMGGHGNGVAYVKKEKVYIRKGLKFPVSKASKLAFNSCAEWFIFHTRWASMGEVSNQNCHPFQYGRIVAAMNGTEFGLRSLSRAMGEITDTEALVISIAASSYHLPAIEIAKRFTELDSVFVGLIKQDKKYVPFASVGPALGDLQVYQDKGAIIMASELPFVDETKVMNAIDGFYWAGGPVPEDSLVKMGAKNRIKRAKSINRFYHEIPNYYGYYGSRGLR